MSVENIKNLKNVNDTPNENVVAQLESALELAKSGQLRSVAIVGSLVGHKSYTAHSGEDYVVLLGQLALLQGILTEVMVAQREPMP